MVCFQLQTSNEVKKNSSKKISKQKKYKLEKPQDKNVYSEIFVIFFFTISVKNLTEPAGSSIMEFL